GERSNSLSVATQWRVTPLPCLRHSVPSGLYRHLLANFGNGGNSQGRVPEERNRIGEGHQITLGRDASSSHPLKSCACGNAMYGSHASGIKTAEVGRGTTNH